MDGSPWATLQWVWGVCTNAQWRFLSFLWGFRQLLHWADPDLTEEAEPALLSRQFMKGLPSNLHLSLLESDPIPTLWQRWRNSFIILEPPAVMGQMSLLQFALLVKAMSHAIPLWCTLLMNRQLLLQPWQPIKLNWKRQWKSKTNSYFLQCHP